MQTTHNQCWNRLSVDFCGAELHCQGWSCYTHALPLWWHFAVASIKIWQIGFSPKLDQIESFSSAYWHIIIWSDSSVQLLLPQQLMMKLNCSSVAAAESVAATPVVHCNSEKQPAACYWPKLCFSTQSFKERVGRALPCSGCCIPAYTVHCTCRIGPKSSNWRHSLLCFATPAYCYSTLLLLLLYFAPPSLLCYCCCCFATAFAGPRVL